MHQKELEALQKSKEGYLVIIERSCFSISNIFCEILSKEILKKFEVSLLKELIKSIDDCSLKDSKTDINYEQILVFVIRDYVLEGDQKN